MTLLIRVFLELIIYYKDKKPFKEGFIEAHLGKEEWLWLSSYHVMFRVHFSYLRISVLLCSFHFPRCLHAGVHFRSLV